MAKVFITNTTDRLISLGSYRGNWASTNRYVNSIPPYAISVPVGTVDHPGTGFNSAWLELKPDGALAPPEIEAYVRLGTSNVRDYAIQLYQDGGLSRDGQTVMGTQAMLYNGDIYFTIEYVFDPWMSRLSDSKRLFEVTIPGTHDSATWKLSSQSSCQDTSIEQQLYMGVRYFDIRLDSSVNGYPVVHGNVHGSGTTEYKLADIARMMRRFLTQPASLQETVVVQIKIDRGPDDCGENWKIIQILKDGFAGELDHLHLAPIQNPAPTMEDLRGKLVVLRRFELDNEYSDEACTPVKYFTWASLQYAWTQGGSSAAPWKDLFDQSAFEWPDQGASQKAYSNRYQQSFVIQDAYKLDAVEKALSTMAFVDGAVSGAYDGGWYLNFSSTAPRADYPVTSAEIVNPLLLNFLATKPNRPQGHGYGTLLMDFANLDLVRSLVQKNF